jgi:hypothetical protein
MSADTESGPAAPSKSPVSSLPSPSQPSLEPRTVPKLELGEGDYTFEGSEEAKPLGPPVATRTPPFLGFGCVSKLDLKVPESGKTRPTIEETESKNPATFQSPARHTADDGPSGTANAPVSSSTDGWGDRFADQRRNGSAQRADFSTPKTTSSAFHVRLPVQVKKAKPLRAAAVATGVHLRPLSEQGGSPLGAPHLPLRLGVSPSGALQLLLHLPHPAEEDSPLVPSLLLQVVATVVEGSSLVQPQQLHPLLHQRLPTIPAPPPYPPRPLYSGARVTI